LIDILEFYATKWTSLEDCHHKFMKSEWMTESYVYKSNGINSSCNCILDEWCHRVPRSHHMFPHSLLGQHRWPTRARQTTSSSVSVSSPPDTVSTQLISRIQPLENSFFRTRSGWLKNVEVWCWYSRLRCWIENNIDEIMSEILILFLPSCRQTENKRSEQ